MAKKAISWRGILAALFAFLSVFALVKTILAVGADQVRAGSPEFVGMLAGVIFWLGLATFFYFRERACRRRTGPPSTPTNDPR
jgi:hypothetical protein